MEIAALSQIVPMVLSKQWRTCLWGINWLSSFSLSSRRGFLGVKEFHEAEEALQKKKNKKKKEKKKKLKKSQKEKAVAIIKRNHSNEVKAWEKLHKDATKGSSLY